MYFPPTLHRELVARLRASDSASQPRDIGQSPQNAGKQGEEPAGSNQKEREK